MISLLLHVCNECCLAAQSLGFDGDVAHRRDLDIAVDVLHGISPSLTLC